MQHDPEAFMTPPAQHPGWSAVQSTVATLQSKPVQPASQAHRPFDAAQLPCSLQSVALVHAKELHAWLSIGVHPS